MRPQGWITLFAVVASLLARVPVAMAEGSLGRPLVTEPFGQFNGVRYLKYTGRFEGETRNGRYRVPYEIVAPANPARGNGIVVVEPPHPAVGPGVRDIFLGQEFFFARGFSHAQVGWGSVGYEIVDPSATDAFIDAGTDFDIVADFVNALKRDVTAARLVGGLRAVYSTGFSASSEPLYAVLHSELAPGLLDLSVLFTVTVGANAEGHEPPEDAGRIMILNTEADVVLFGGANLRANDALHPSYRLYEVAGGPHIPNVLVGRRSLLGNDWIPFLRALFVAGDRWSVEDRDPPPSAFLEASEAIDPVYGYPTGIARDQNLNAIGGIRSPDLEAGRAQFLAVDFDFFFLFGDVLDLRCEPLSDGSLRFENHGVYLSRFVHQANALESARFLLPSDRAMAVRQAAQSVVGMPGSCP